MSDVYFISATLLDSPDAIDHKIDKLWNGAAFANLFQPHDLSAIKMHVGEPKATTFMPPKMVVPIVRRIEQAQAHPFITDTSVLYRSPRGNGVTHAHVVRDHGFGFEAIGAPFISADGLLGNDEIEMPVQGRHYTRVSIASAIINARSMIVLSHATGHLATGFGGAIKNLGMGCSSKKAKLRQHHGQQPHINAKHCIGCGTCAEWCPSDAILMKGIAEIHPDKCIGCGECIAVCMECAVEFQWGIAGGELQERIVEHAMAVIQNKPGKIGYITLLANITKDCDCIAYDQKPLIPDIGILASQDPVAIDQAAMDLIQERAGKSIESMSYPKRDGRQQIRYANDLGLGDPAYSLHTVSL